MEKFDELKNLWNRQSLGLIPTQADEFLVKIESHIKQMRTGQQKTLFTLIILLVILISYSLWVLHTGTSRYTLGLGLMIGAIMVRVTFEGLSIFKFNSVKPDLAMIEFREKITKFYFWKNRVNRIFIPILYGIYLLGFTFLVPVFKDTLSSGMFLYVILSGYGFLFLFTFVVRKKVRKEKMILEFLKRVSET
ncbi:hypothetical protein [Algoriphagus confluentis]|uniref:Uncharacterized protein n=1 Tax=Algoriphagus confluentis TaxID=1697556 RepID=A0ABQ6PV92_9BACT|nr:hypothetical protein Aconfl_41910 [Algoriphagus confluentis]